MTTAVTIRRTKYGPTIANAWLAVRCPLARGVLAFRDVAGGRTVLREAAAAVEMAGGQTVSTLDRGFDPAWRVEETADILGSGLTLRLSTRPTDTP